MHPKEGIRYQPISSQDYAALQNTTGAYCVRHTGVGAFELGLQYQYLVDGQLHREGGPAKQWQDGTQEWYQHGKPHREDGPAFVHEQGQKLVWMHHGLVHRLDGPAVIQPDCSWWYQQGKLHRLDGPALMSTNGVQKWFQRGQYHREDGPALLRINPKDGKVLEERWYRQGQLHREDGPALQTAKGVKKWYLLGNQVPYKQMPYVQAQRMSRAMKSETQSKKKTALGMAL